MYSRRTFLRRAAATALASAGLYETLDALTAAAGAAPPFPPPPPGPRPGPPPPPPPGARATGGEQYLFAQRIVVDNGTVVLSPPLHHAVVTAELTGPVTAAAQARFEAVLTALERAGLLDFTATGGGVTVAWGRPYFDRLPPRSSPGSCRSTGSPRRRRAGRCPRSSTRRASPRIRRRSSSRRTTWPSSSPRTRSST